MLICKKCKGNHLTIKCNKNQKKQIKKNVTKNKNINLFCIKISNLPDDVTIKELNDLIRPWGKIGNINFGKSVNKTAYIDFYEKDEAEYFKKALDKTPFDNLIINVEFNIKK